LAPFARWIESLETRVILTWHYRPMDTAKGKAELQRVRAQLDTLDSGPSREEDD
jgi:hypothetical protein